MQSIIRSIFRYRYKSAATTAVTALFTAVFCVFLGSIGSAERQLNALPTVVPVFCRITNADGSRTAGLAIDGALADDLARSAHVKDAAFTVRMLSGVGDFPIEEWAANLNLGVLAANRVSAVPGLFPENVSLPAAKLDALLASDKAACNVSASVMEARGRQLGDTVPLNLYYFTYDDIAGINCTPLTITDVTIAVEMTDLDAASAESPSNILLPLDTVRALYAMC